MNSIVRLFCTIELSTLATAINAGHFNTAHTIHTTQDNTTQHNDNNIPLIVIPTYKTMAEVLGAVASAVAVVEAAGKVWSTSWKYYQVRFPPTQFEPQSVVNNFIWG